MNSILLKKAFDIKEPLVFEPVEEKQNLKASQKSQQNSQHKNSSSNKSDEQLQLKDSNKNNDGNQQKKLSGSQPQEQNTQKDYQNQSQKINSNQESKQKKDLVLEEVDEKNNNSQKINKNNNSQYSHKNSQKDVENQKDDQLRQKIQQNSKNIKNKEIINHVIDKHQPKQTEDKQDNQINQFLKEFETELEQINPFQMIAQIMDIEQYDTNKSEQETLTNKERTFFDIQNVTKDNEIINLKEQKNIVFNHVLFEIKELQNKFLILNLIGTGVLYVEIFDKEKQVVIKEIGQVQNSDLFIQKRVIFEYYFFRHYVGKYIRFGLQTMILGESMNISLEEINYFDMNFGEHLKLDTQFTHTIKIKIKFTKKQNINKNTRIQFILKSDLIHTELAGDEEMSLQINYNKLTTEEQWDMEASGTIGNGLIKTINSENEQFCVEQSCFYYARIKLRNINSIVFLPSTFDNGSTITFQKKLNLLEEIEPQELVIYKLKIQRQKNSKILFTLQPTEDDTTLYINPDQPIEKLEEVEYISAGKGHQAIVITQDQLDEFNYSGEIFYVAFQSTNQNQGSTFSFQANVLKEKEEILIDEDYFISGVIIKEEIVNYYMNFFSGESEQFSIDFILHNTKEKANLVVKECKEGQEICLISDQDLNKENQDKNIIFKAAEIGKNSNKMNLQFNCIGNDPFEVDSKFQNSFKQSHSCKFAVAVFSIVEKSKFIPYTLEIVGSNVINNLLFGISHNLTLLPLEEKNYHFHLQEMNQMLSAEFRVVALTGKSQIYFSTKNKLPDQSNNEGVIYIDNMNLSQIKVKTYHLKIDFKGKKQFNNDIYMSIFADQYTAIDIYSEVLDKNDQKMNWVLFEEPLTLNKLVLRMIQKKEYHKDKEQQKDIYFKNFKFKIPQKIKNLQNLFININSKIMGLFLCVQKNKEKFDFNSPCDFSSQNESLEIYIDQQNGKQETYYSISVQKIITQDEEIFNAFPITFDILIHTKKSHNKIELLSPSIIHTKKVYNQSHLTFQIDLSIWKKKGTIVITTHSIELQIYIQTSLKKHQDLVQKLDSSNFGIIIENVSMFKKKYCKNKKCFLYVIVQNDGFNDARFSLSYIYDNLSFILKEGEQIFLPCHKKTNFIGIPQRLHSISFNYYNNYFKSVALGKIIEIEGKDIDLLYINKFLNEEKFEYKTNIDSKGSIVIKKDDFKSYEHPIILFTLLPKFNLTKERKNLSYSLLNEEDKTKVSFDFHLLKLDPYSERQGEIQQGQFKYYHFVNDSKQDLSLFLTNQFGSAKLYLKKGFNNLPTLKSYWKKSDGTDSQMMMIKHKDKQNGSSESYTIGVYGLLHSQYSLMLVNNDHNLIKVDYQKIFSMDIEKDKLYFFDYYNQHKKFEIIVYSDQSDIEISIIKYDPDFGENFLNVIKNESNVTKKQIFKKGSPPWTFNDLSIFDISLHFIVRIRAIDMNTQVDLAIFNPEYPLVIPNHKQIYFALGNNKTQVFKTVFKHDFRMSEIHIKLEYGQLEYSICNQSQNFKNKTSLLKPSQKRIFYNDTSDQQNNNDIVIFSEINIQIKCFELCKFGILVKPKDMFQQLKPFENLIVTANKFNDHYVYFSIDQNDIIHYQKLQIEIDFLQTIQGQNIELLYNGKDDIQLDAKNKFLPMPIKEQYKFLKFQDVHELIIPKIKQGYYVIKIPKTEKENHLKIAYLINDEKKLDVNESYKLTFNQLVQKKKFYIYLPEKGEYRVVLETCEDIQMQKMWFEDKQVDLPDNLVQEYQYFTKGHNSEQYKVQKLQIPVMRILNEDKGMVSFEIKNNSQNKNANIEIISEFRPNRKELILKDYIDYYPMNNEHFYHSFDQKTKNLNITSSLPQFKSQFFKDYPKTKFIKVIYHLYLIPDSEFLSKYQVCGNGALYNKKSFIKSQEFLFENKTNQNSKVDIEIDYNEMKQFKGNEFLTIFALLQITIIENQEQQYDITLNQKITEVPFFGLVIKNENLSYWQYLTKDFQSVNILWIQITLLCFVVLIILIVCKNIKRKKKEMKSVIVQSKDNYINPQESNNSTLEMNQ